MQYKYTVYFPDADQRRYALTTWRDDHRNLPRFTLERFTLGGETETILADGNWGAAVQAFDHLGGFASEVVLRTALRNYDASRPGVSATV